LSLQDLIPSAKATPLSQFFIAPKKVIWSSAKGVTGAKNLLAPKPGQATLKSQQKTTRLTSTKQEDGAILLDFGVEIHGYVEIFISDERPSKLVRKARVRLGESVSEAMSELGGQKNAGNDHAIRDQKIDLPWLGKKTIGPSGFRFVRIDNLDPEIPLHISEVRAVLQIRDVPYLGSFESNDERLNKIWQTGAYTVHLNMQEYLWDGIKRDRLVWVGDLHPEVCTVNAVFGSNPVVNDSLDLIRDITPPSQWMNGISSYSIWWILIHEELYMQQGDLPYLKKQKKYLVSLLQHLTKFIQKNGKECLDGFRFLDWPTANDPKATHEGLQALLAMAMEKGAFLMKTLGEKDMVTLCLDHYRLLKKHRPSISGRKSPSALLALAGLKKPDQVSSSILKKNGVKDVSTFYGFYILNTLAEAGEVVAAQNLISKYWGGMLDLGATSFWEDFNLDWTKNSGRIDEMVPDGKNDIHGDFGAFCYKGFRHSFCHGWASGPTAWLSRYVLGISPAEPGFSKVRIQPQLGKLKEVKGTYPTPKGIIRVHHQKKRNGRLESDIELPDGVELVD
jgi:alpha-L-rhamnosidase